MEDRARAAGDLVVVVTLDRLVRGRGVAEEPGCEIANKTGGRGPGTGRTSCRRIGENVAVTRPQPTRRPLLGGAVACLVLGLAALGPSAAALTPATVEGAGPDTLGAAGPSAYAGTTRQAREANAAIAKLAASAEDAARKLARGAWVLPLGSYRLTARFGQCSRLWSHCHTGLDFAAPSGTPVRAVARGTVTEVGWAGAYGNRTVETLQDGTEVWYCHQSTFGVRVGQAVSSGQAIGLVGATGNTTGPHLHLEVRPGAGDAVDPFQALLFHGATP